MDTLSSIANTNLLLPSLQAITVLSLAFLAGLASCLSLWVIPVIKHPMNTPRITIAQFDYSISKGENYLLPSGRVLGVLLVSMMLLTSQHPDENIAEKWKYYLAAMIVVTQVAWYEVVFIFPINRKVRAMGEAYDAKKEQSFSDTEQRRLHELLDSWNRWHIFRIIAPFIGACISIAAII